MRVLAAACAVQVMLAAQSGGPPARISAREFPLMAWGESPADAEQLRGMYDAGLNISGFCKPTDLDLVAAARLSCFVTDSRANDYDWTRLPDDASVRARINALAAEVRGKPALLGFFLRDEPHASLFPGLARVAAFLREAMPGTWPYVNLFSSRATPERMGAPSYAAYARMLADVVHQPFLSYDNYALIGGDALESFYTNLEIIRRVGAETHIPFWNCIQASAFFNLMEPS